jgi:hypothetical protein
VRENFAGVAFLNGMNVSSSGGTAVFAAAVIAAQFVAGKATRDALFLTSLHFTALPAMLVGAAAVSLLMLAVHARAARTDAPARLMRGTLAVSAALFVAEWLLNDLAPIPIAILIYLHVSAVTSLLAVSWWRALDQTGSRTGAELRLAGTTAAGGVFGALCAERIAALAGGPAMLLCLAAFQIVAAWALRRSVAQHLRTPEPHSPVPTPRHRRTIAPSHQPSLRLLGAVVFLGTVGAVLVEYLFKAMAAETFGPGDSLMRFFAAYSAVTSLGTFALQTSLCRAALDRFGIGLACGAPSIALLAGCTAGFVMPELGTLGSLTVTRAGEAIFRGSWFRAGCAVYSTPFPQREQEAAQSIVHVGFNRFADGAGGVIVWTTVAIAPALQSPLILTMAVMTSAAAILAASGLTSAYTRTVSRSIVDIMRSAEPFCGVNDWRASSGRANERDRAKHLRLVDTSATTTLTPSSFMGRT